MSDLQNLLLTTRDLEDLFEVTPVTIHNWRKKLGLPCITIPSRSKNAIRFDKAAVLEWAEKQNKTIKK